MKSVAGNHPWEKKPANRDEIYGWKSSLREETSKSGWNLWLGIISTRRNLQIEMKFRNGNHPWEEKPANQDEFYGWESSLREETSKSGCNPWPEIIPGRRNLQIGMKSMAGNHPWEEKPANRDEIPGRESSLWEETSKSGWNPRLEIIPVRRNLQIEMKFRGGNHPCEKKPANRDEILWLGIIPARRNQQIRMNSMAGNHPCEKKPANRDEISAQK